MATLAQRIIRRTARSAKTGAKPSRLIGTYSVNRASKGFCTGTINVTFIEDGQPIETSVRIGQSILEAAHDNEIELEGACDSQLACSTCHVILDQVTYSEVPEPCDEELDMLDLAVRVTDTSRLGCQINLTKAMDGITIEIPQSVDAR
mmetsp:Transcript_26605/g.37127  ORF Transcript_26605/g.37127 Transcript_26605/m.37127 type:complete len:148 (+) Transcript_26605:127-570(+)